MTSQEAEDIVEPVLEYMEDNRVLWYFPKENDPVNFGRLLNNFFERVRGYRLQGLDTYVRWIHAGGWYHKTVLDNEQLDQVPHLQFAPHPPPGVDRPTDSTLRSHRDSYERAMANGSDRAIARWRRTYGETLRLHGMIAEANRVDPRPATGPAVSAPTPGVRTPNPPPARGASAQTVPMEVEQRRDRGRPSPSMTTQPSGSMARDHGQTGGRRAGGGGNAVLSPTPSVSWADQMSDEEASQWESGWNEVRNRRHKRPRDPADERQQQLTQLHKEARSPQPFPLRKYEERATATYKLFEAAGQLPQASCSWIKHIVTDRYPQKSMEEIIYITNIIVVMISEFHLTSTCVPVGHCRIIIPTFIEDELPPEEEYLTPEEQGVRDVRVLNWAALKRVAVWLQQLETIANYGEGTNRSLHREDHSIANLCRLLMDVGTCPFDEDDVLARVVAENIEDAKQQYSIAERNHEAALRTHQGLVEKVCNAEVEYTNIPVGHGSRQSKADDLVRLKSQKERALSTIEEHRDTMSSLHLRLHLVGMMDAPLSTPVEEEEEESRHSETDEMEVDEAEEDQEEEEEDETPEGDTPGNDLGAPLPPGQGQSSAEGATPGAALPQGTELPTKEDDILLDGDEEPSATTGGDDPPVEFSGELEGARTDSPSAHQ